MFSISSFRRAFVGLGIVASAACAGTQLRPGPAGSPQSFYTVTAEIALARHEAHTAALQYAAAAQVDPSLLPRAAQVAAETLQPTIGLHIAERWIQASPKSLDAQRAAAAAALALHRIDQAATHYRALLTNSPNGVEAEFSGVEKDLRDADNVYGARQLADRLAAFFPSSPAARRLQGFAALRADDPAAAVNGFRAALALRPAGSDADKELTQAMRRARVMAGDADAPLAEARADLESDNTPARRFDYSVLLLAAKRDDLARAQLAQLLGQAGAAPDALRIAGLLEFQDGNYDAAGLRFAELLNTGRYVDDAYYYLGLIAERHADLERALTSYARVQNGENGVPALLRAASILYTHGEASAADDLLDQLLSEEPGRAPEILAARAQIYVQAGDAKHAAAVLDKAVAEYPDSSELHYARASNMEERGQIDAALRELAAMVEARPDDPAALNALGYTLADHSRRIARARALIARAYAAAPRSAAIRDSVGWALYRQGRAAEALPFLESAFADEPGGDIGAHLGEVLWQLGKRSDAERIWADAGGIDAENRLLKSTRKRMRPAK